MNRGYIIGVLFFIFSGPKLCAQQNTNTLNVKSYKTDSAKVIRLLAQANDCIKSASVNCSESIKQALKISTKQESAFLTSLCYSAFANAERRNRTALLFKYDSLSVVYARLSQNDSLLINALLISADDFCLVNTPGKGKQYIDESFSLLKKNENKYLMMLAKYEQGFYFDKDLDFIKATSIYKQALDYARILHNEYWIARLYKSISLMNAIVFKKIDSSNSIFEALEYFKNKDSYEVANCLAVIGHVYRQNGNYIKASSYFDQAASIYKTEHYPAQEAEMYVLIAEKFIENKEPAKGIFLTAKAEKIYSSIGYEYGVNYTYITKGRLYGTEGNLVRSNFYFNKVDSVLKLRPNKRMHFLLLSAKVTTNVYNGNAAAVNNIIDSAAKITTTLLSKEITDGLITHATSTGLLTKAEAVDLKKYTRTGKLDTTIWNKKKDIEGFNQFTADLPKFNGKYNELFNGQITEMETKYRTKIKDDSLKNVVNENKISQFKIERQNGLIFLISIITLAVGIILYQINRARKRVVLEKETVELLKAEADHRVKNTLSTINSIVRIVKSQSSDKAHFNLLEERIDPLMILYQMLNSKRDEHVDLQQYFEKLCNKLQIAYGNTNVQVHVFAPVMLQGKKAGIAGLIVNELVSNSFKYAFTEKQEGKISVMCEKDDKAMYKLHVSDSGKGFTRGAENVTSKGLLLVNALAQQLSATVTEKSENGVVFEFYFS